MLAILLHSINHPDILAHSTLLKKNIIIKLILLLSLVLSVPSIIQTHQLLQQTQQDIAMIATNLPDFNTSQPSAIQTTQAYFLYDSAASVSQSTIEKTITNYTLGVIIQNKKANIYILGSQVLTHDAQSANQIEDILNSLAYTLPITQFITPFFVFLFNIFSVITQNYILSLTCSLFFMFRNKLVKFKHLWRVNLFASFGPYVILSVLNLFKLSIPFELFWVLLYTIYVQTTVIKNVTK